jgi:hypothetical protein
MRICEGKYDCNCTGYERNTVHIACVKLPGTSAMFVLLLLCDGWVFGCCVGVEGEDDGLTSDGDWGTKGESEAEGDGLDAYNEDV